MSVLDALSRLCEQFGVTALYAFGSRARQALRYVESGEPLPASSSDLDIGFLAARALSVHEKVRLAVALEDFFNVPRVDVVALPEADPFVALAVIRGERLYARDAHRADEYELYVLRRAGDLLPLERERLALLAEKKTRDL